MGKNLDGHAHDDRDGRSGRYRKTLRARADEPEPDAAVQCLEERIAKAAAMIARCAVTDGAHHKQWCLDQTIRALFTEEQYAAWTAEMAANPDREPWDIGIAP